jgi:hypothetical protein
MLVEKAYWAQNLCQVFTETYLRGVFYARITFRQYAAMHVNLDVNKYLINVMMLA